MKDEPELVDLFALVAMYAYIRGPHHEIGPDEIASVAYETAWAMMEERNNQND